MTAREARHRSQLAGDDAALIEGLGRGDEAVFCHLVDQWSGMMLRVARTQVASRASAEDVVQDAWLTVIRSLDRFERRSTLRTWVIGIVVNLARARARAERRMAQPVDEAETTAVDAARFLPADHPRWPRHWATEPAPWRTPEDELLAAETRRVLSEAIEALPAAQREVIVLRDLEGVAAAEVCNMLNLTDTHQRVLLHRARTRVRASLEHYLSATEVR